MKKILLLFIILSTNIFILSMDKAGTKRKLDTQYADLDLYSAEKKVQERQNLIRKNYNILRNIIPAGICSVRLGSKVAPDPFKYSNTDLILDVPRNRMLAINKNNCLVLSADKLEILIKLTHDDKITSALFCHDDNHVITALKSNKINICDFINQTTISYYVNFNINSIVISPNNKYLIITGLTFDSAGEYTSTIFELWDIEQKNQAIVKAKYKSENCQDELKAAFSRDSKYYYISEENKLLKFNVETAQLVGSFEYHKDTINSLDISQNDQFIISCSDQYTVVQAANQDFVTILGGKKQKDRVHQRSITNVKFSSNNKYAISSAQDIALWDISNFDQKKPAELIAKFGPIGTGLFRYLEFDDKNERIYARMCWAQNTQVWHLLKAWTINDLNLEQIDFLTLLEKYSYAHAKQLIDDPNCAKLFNQKLINHLKVLYSKKLYMANLIFNKTNLDKDCCNIATRYLEYSDVMSLPDNLEEIIQTKVLYNTSKVKSEEQEQVTQKTKSVIDFDNNPYKKRKIS